MKRGQGLTRLAPTRRDRIVFIASTLPVGGTEIHLLDLMRGLSSLGFEPHLLILKEPGPLGERVIADGSVPVVYGLKKRGVTPGLLRRIYTELRRIDPKALITFEHDDVMLAGRIAARLARVPRVVTLMHTTNRRDGTPTVTRLFRLMKRFSDIYTSPAHGHRDHLAAQGLPLDRLAVVVNGVDIHRFRPGPRDPAVLQSLGLQDSGPVVGMVAAFRPEKNHELALEAFLLVRSRVPSARLLLLGDGPRRAVIEARVRELDLQEAVHFAGVRHDLERILPQLNVVLLASEPRVETLSIALLEAMACGRPVVATDVGFLSEAIEDGVNGFLSPPGSASSMARAVTEILLNETRARRFGEAARSKVETRFSLVRMLEDYRAILLPAGRPGHILGAQHFSSGPAPAPPL